jgi:hypothetical protein
VQIARWWNFCDSLDLEGVHHDAVLGDNEHEEVSKSDAKDALEGIQANIILLTSLENDA